MTLSEIVYCLTYVNPNLKCKLLLVNRRYPMYRLNELGLSIYDDEESTVSELIMYLQSLYGKSYRECIITKNDVYYNKLDDYEIDGETDVFLGFMEPLTVSDLFSKIIFFDIGKEKYVKQ